MCNMVKGIKGECSLFEGLNTKFDTFGANGIKRVELAVVCRTFLFGNENVYIGAHMRENKEA